MANLFGKAKKKTVAKKNVKEKVMITPTFDSTEEAEVFNKQLQEFAGLKKEIDNLTAKMKSLDSTIKTVGMDEFNKHVEKTGKRESSYILTTAGANVMVTVMDKYKTIDADRAEYLEENYEGAGLVNEDTTFSFNTKVLERNQDAISELIENSEDISDEDKEDLIVSTTKYSINKGTIDKVYKISQDLELDVETVMEEISPIMSLKNATNKEDK
jgi:predicted transcriptional regulator